MPTDLSLHTPDMLPHYSDGTSSGPDTACGALPSNASEDPERAVFFEWIARQPASSGGWPPQPACLARAGADDLSTP